MLHILCQCSVVKVKNHVFTRFVTHGDIRGTILTIELFCQVVTMPFETPQSFATIWLQQRMGNLV
jgi:hypothetical protein